MARDPVGVFAGDTGGDESTFKGVARVFTRAVVEDVLNDLGLRTEDQIDELMDGTFEGEKILIAPRNALLVRPVTDEADKLDGMTHIAYPFFPPYLCFPIKAGEQVWVVADALEGGAELFWMCRIPEHDYIDDLNYTHGDRKFDAIPGPPSDTVSVAEEPASPDAPEPLDFAEADTVPGFTNGPPGTQSYTLRGPDDYEHIFTGSVGNMSVTFEPVPRFTKRPGDMVLQGSNNTLICLGEDRGWIQEETAASKDAEWSNATTGDGDIVAADPNERSFAGTIDIVAGRGRAQLAPGDDIELTSGRIITNARGYDEIDKNPVPAETSDKDENRFDNPSEGDPCFMKDAARIYVSMKTNGDTNFGLKPDSDPIGMAKGMSFDIEPVDEAAYIVAKADEIRLVARKNEADDPAGYPEINGSIRLIKEGDPTDDMAVIVMLPDGKIQISGSTIHLGRDEAVDGGLAHNEGADNDIALDEQGEPWMRYSDFCVWADGLINAINDQFAKHQEGIEMNATAIDGCGNELAGASGFSSNAPPGYGIPDANVIDGGVSVMAAGAAAIADHVKTQGWDDQDEEDAIKGFMSATDPIAAIKSARVFGE